MDPEDLKNLPPELPSHPSEPEKKPSDTLEQASSPELPSMPLGQSPRGRGASSKRGIRGFARRHKKGGIIGGSIGAAILAVFVGFLLILPFKALHFLKIIEDKSFAKVENVITIRTEKVLDRYIAKRLENGAAGKWGHATNGYGIVATGDLAHDLYQNWMASDFERNMTDKYGISFERTPDGRYNVLQNGQVVPGADGTNLEGIGNQEFRNYIKDSTKQETHVWQIFKRHNMREALYARWGVKKWIFFSGTRQRIQDVRLAAKLFVLHELNNRVITPISGKFGDIFACMFLQDNGACKSARDTSSKSSVGGDAAKAAQEADAAAKHASDALDKDAEKSTTKEVYQKIVGKLTNSLGKNIVQETTEDETEALIPFAGEAGIIWKWLRRFQRVSNDLKPNGSLDKAATAEHSITATQFFSTNATAIDQIKAGGALNAPISSALKAAFSNFTSRFRAFAADNATATSNTDYTQAQIGVYGAQLGDPTESRIYKKYYAGIDTSKMHDNVKCSDNKPLPPNQVICDDQRITPDLNNIAGFAAGNTAIAAVKTLGDGINSYCDATDSGINIPLVGEISTCHALDIGQGILNLGGTVINWILDNTGLTSLMNSLVGELLKVTGLQDVIGTVVQWVVGQLVGVNITGLETGGKWFDAMQAGADVTSNSSGQEIGARPLNDVELSQWGAKLQNDEIAKTQGAKGVWYKIASLDSPNSLFGRLVAWTPSTMKEVPTKMAALTSGLLNPKSILDSGKYLASVVIPGNHLAFADSPAYVSPFGVGSWGYALNDPYLNMSADALDETCKVGSESRKKIEDEYKADLDAYINQTPENPHTMTKTNPCALEEKTIHDLGSYFNTQDDGGLKATTTSTTSNAPTGTLADCPTGNVTGGMKILCVAEKFQGYPYVTGGGWTDDLAGYVARLQAGERLPMDCGGLIRVSAFIAYNVNVGNPLGDVNGAQQYFKKIDKNDVQPGDFLFKGISSADPSGHVAIVVNHAPGSNTVDDFEASNPSLPIGPQTYNMDFFDYGGRWVGPSQ